MPRLTEEVRLARRVQIAEAALRCFARQGIDATSMADIIKEAGLSAGSVYSHFEGRAALLRFTAATVLESRGDGLLEMIEAMPVPPGPGAVLRLLVEHTIPVDVRSVMVQLFGQVFSEPELRGVMTETVRRAHRMIARALGPWARSVDPERADELALRHAGVTLTSVHGYMLRLAIDPDAEGSGLLGDVVASLDAVPPLA